MSENMKLWDAVCQPPTSALKRITGGRLNGKTDINPQWRIKAMTEQFGPCGSGWGYQIIRLWTEPGADGEVAAFAQVGVWIGDNSTPVPGVGGSMLIENEKAGPHTNDEAFKMAVTDALSVALKNLGVAADIYLGYFDGSKYNKPSEPTEATPEAWLIMYNENLKTLGDRKMDGSLDDAGYAKARAWLDTCLKTVPGQTAAKRKLAERFAKEPAGKKEITDKLSKLADEGADKAFGEPSQPDIF